MNISKSADRGQRLRLEVHNTAAISGSSPASRIESANLAGWRTHCGNFSTGRNGPSRSFNSI